MASTLVLLCFQPCFSLRGRFSWFSRSLRGSSRINELAADLFQSLKKFLNAAFVYISVATGHWCLRYTVHGLTVPIPVFTQGRSRARNGRGLFFTVYTIYQPNSTFLSCLNKNVTMQILGEHYFY